MKRTMLIVAIALMAGSVYGGWSYNAGEAMAASYENGTYDPPEFNPSGQFIYVNETGDLLTPTGGVQWSGQPGWEDVQDPVTGFYGVFWNLGWAGWDPVTSPIVGHAPTRVLFIVPAMEAGNAAVRIDGQATQLWETARQCQLLINGVPFVTAVPGSADVTYATTFIPATAGDIIEITVGGDGPLGNGVTTFTGWDLTITEVACVPEPLTMVLLGVGSVMALRRRR